MIAISSAIFLQWTAAALINTAALNTVRDLRISLFTKLNLVPVQFIDSSSGGDIMARVTADTEQITDGLVHGATNMFAGIVTALGTLSLMFYINWIIALIVAIITPLSIFISFLIARSCRKKFNEQSALRGRLAGIAEEYIGSQKLVLSYDYGKKAEEKFNTVNHQLKKVGTKATFHSSLTNPSARLVNNIVYAIAATMGAIFIINDNLGLTVGLLSTILAYANQYARPFNEITAIVTELQTSFAGARRIFEVLDKCEETSDNGFPSLGDCNGNLDITNVNFSYTETTLITGFNLAAKKGQRIAIVGPTGSGKTTVINLLMRFYDPQSGTIMVDGTDISKVTRQSLRACYGMVLQESWLFKGTVRDNIAYGKPNATDEEIIEAAKSADIHNYISRLENGYDTVITEGGGNISQGQMQLLCIARIMLRLPPMLILDEATSSIDTRTEVIIQNAFSKMMEGRTSFIIAHRLSTIREADVILVLNNGNIIEKGTHDELIAADGFYHNLYNSQFEPL
ncbi:atp-binding cassette sub-family b [Holotrichia oblita]|nr:atp-binding cassette sub-family b [Holotrichia oblita]